MQLQSRDIPLAAMCNEVLSRYQARNYSISLYCCDVIDVVTHVVVLRVGAAV
jgi:hypothetical protein